MEDTASAEMRHHRLEGHNVADSEPSRNQKRCALVAFGTWVAVLVAVGATGLLLWFEHVSTEPLRLMVVAAYSGAWGGWAKSISEIHTFMYKLRNQEHLDCWSPSSWNNFVLKPLFWPIAGGLFGLALTLVFYDSATPPVRAILTGIAGGAFWDTVLKNLGGLRNLVKPKRQGSG